MNEEPQLDATIQVDEASQPYIGRWNDLVSTTNWEKGRIIAEWRDALVAAGAGVSEYADDAWATRVGGVTPQHVGRLRRVYQRFHATHSQYHGLFWSHFQAAIEWDDAEMWLEGAAQSGWSVAGMRRTRWETMGSAAALEPREDEIVASEPEEDFVAAQEFATSEPGDSTHRDSSGGADGPRHDGPDFGDDDSLPEMPETDVDTSHVGDLFDADEKAPAAETVRPFANLAELPADLAEAFDALKLAILHHKADNWAKVPCGDVLAALDALKSLAVAPSDK